MARCCGQKQRNTHSYVLAGHCVLDVAPCAAATTAATESMILLLPVMLLLVVLLIPLFPLLLLLRTPWLRQLVSSALATTDDTTAAYPVLAYLPPYPRPCLPLAWSRPSLPSSGSRSPCLPHDACVSVPRMQIHDVTHTQVQGVTCKSIMSRCVRASVHGVNDRVCCIAGMHILPCCLMGH